MYNFKVGRSGHVPHRISVRYVMWEVEIESIRKMIARAADTGHSN